MFYGVLNRLRTISSCHPRTVIQISKQQQCLSTKVQSPSEKDPESSEKKKKRFIPKITLLQQEAITITTLEEAQKLSKRRDLKLIKLTDLDTKTQRPVYKLMTGSEYHQEELKQRELRKKEKGSGDVLRGDKVLILNSVISQHDLSTHVNKIRKWLTKKYEVRISINCDASVEKGVR